MDKIDFDKLEQERQKIIDDYAVKLKSLKECDTQLRDFFNLSWRSKVRAADLQLKLVDKKTGFAIKQQKKQDALDRYITKRQNKRQRKKDKKSFLKMFNARQKNGGVKPACAENSACAENHARKEPTEFSKLSRSRKILKNCGDKGVKP